MSEWGVSVIVSQELLFIVYLLTMKIEGVWKKTSKLFWFLFCMRLRYFSITDIDCSVVCMWVCVGEFVSLEFKQKKLKQS